MLTSLLSFRLRCGRSLPIGLSACGVIAFALLASSFSIPSGSLLAADEPPIDRPAGPSVRFAENEIDYGDLLQGELIEREVVIHNDGLAELQITKATPNCGCTEVVSFPPAIEPGGQGVLKFTVNSKKIKPGSGRKRIRLDTNNALDPNPGYYFTVNVVALYRSEPSDIRVGGVFDAEKRTRIRLIQNSDYGFDLDSAVSRNGMFTIEDFVWVKDGVYELTVVVAPSAAPEVTRDPLDFVINVKDGRTIKVGQWVNIEHWNPVLVVPENVLQFGNRETDLLLADNALPVSKTVTLRSRDPERNFSVLGVKIEDAPEGAFDAQIIPRTEGSHYQIKVLLPKYQSQSFITGKLVITTDAEIDPVRTITLRAKFGRRKP